MRCLGLFLCLALPAFGAQMEVLTVDGFTLRDNPLGDLNHRHAAVISPKGTDAQTPLPLVLYLPGWGGSAEDTIASPKGGWIGQAVDKLASEGHTLRVVVPDARSRYGGSQYLNSAATGRYADYVADEVLAMVESKYKTELPALVAGHSSGGYGALMLAIGRHTVFRAVVGLSPDSDFEVTHKPLVQAADVQAVTPAELALAMAPAGQSRTMPGLAGLIMGLCANYVPRVGHPGQFEWIYDDRGNFRAAAWAKWIECDPLTVVSENPEAFSPEQRIYLDGAEHDEFGANIGARKIAVVLKGRGAQVEFKETQGHHGDHLAERLTRGLGWVLGK